VGATPSGLTSAHLHHPPRRTQQNIYLFSYATAFCGVT